MNATPQRHSTQCKKATPQKKKNSYKTKRLETIGVKPYHEARGVEQ